MRHHPSSFTPDAPGCRASRRARAVVPQLPQWPTLPLLALIGLTAAALPLHADPMRPLTPPPTAVAAAPMASWQTTRPVAPAAAGASVTPTIQADRLVAIRRDSDGRWRALLGERWVSVGAKAGTATVRTIDHNSVTLAEGRAQLVLHLLPPLVASRDLDAASAAASAATPRRRHRALAAPLAASAPAPSAAPATAPATPLPTRSAAAPASPPSDQAASPALTAALSVVRPAPTSPRATP